MSWMMGTGAVQLRARGWISSAAVASGRDACRHNSRQETEGRTGLRLAFHVRFPNRPRMALPSHPVTFTPEQIVALKAFAALEDIRAEDFDEWLKDAPHKIADTAARREAILQAIPGYTLETIVGLNMKLKRMRHDVNGKLAVIMAAVELAKLRPDTAAKMLDRLMDQPDQITKLVNEFSDEFEKTLGVPRR
jgi:hypothetical protein